MTTEKTDILVDCIAAVKIITSLKDHIINQKEFIGSIQAENERLKKENGEMLKLIEFYVDNERCDYDHHGNCQSHGSTSDGFCPNNVAKEIIEKSKEKVQ